MRPVIKVRKKVGASMKPAGTIGGYENPSFDMAMNESEERIQAALRAQGIRPRRYLGELPKEYLTAESSRVTRFHPRD